MSATPAPSAVRQPRLSRRGWLLVGVALVVVWSGIAPYDRADWCLEHVPTAVTLAFLVWHARRAGGPLSDLAYGLLAVFTTLHAVGSHWLYSRVPYVEWWLWSTGGVAVATDVPARNHFDRFVHFAFGALVLLPLAEVVRRHVSASRAWIVAIAVLILSFLGTAYELIEWCIALWMSPEAADAYNGQQGDVFDAQKDLVLGLLGAALAAPFVGARLARSGGETPARQRSR